MPRLALLVLALVCLPSLALAQAEVETDDSPTEIDVPPPPDATDEGPFPAVSPPPMVCSEGFPTDTGCTRTTTRWVWGPSLEMIGGSVALFGAAYLVQLLSSAVSVAQGEHDVGPEYSRESLDEYRDWAYLPLVGPWAKLVLQPPHVDEAGGVVFALEGLIELGAVVCFVLSFFGELREESVRDVAGRWRIAPHARGLSLELTF